MNIDSDFLSKLNLADCVFQEEGGQFDDHDVDTLLDGAGITGFKLCETLKLIHSSVKEHLSFANHCHVVELLRVAALTHQQLQHGADLVTAILNSSLDVYVRGQSDPTLKKVRKLFYCSDVSCFICCSGPRLTVEIWEPRYRKRVFLLPSENYPFISVF